MALPGVAVYFAVDFINASVPMPTNPGTNVLPIIRIALLAGVVFLGAVAIYLAKSGTVEPVQESLGQTLRMVFVVVLAGAAVAMFVLRRKRLALSSHEDPTVLNIVGWALGEGVALIGAVLLILTGDVLYFLVGFVMMLVSFVFFPLPDQNNV